MRRPLRIDFAGALYHVMSRGNRREDIFRDETDRVWFLDTLDAAWLKGVCFRGLEGLAPGFDHEIRRKNGRDITGTCGCP